MYGVAWCGVVVAVPRYLPRRGQPSDGHPTEQREEQRRQWQRKKKKTKTARWMDAQVCVCCWDRDRGLGHKDDFGRCRVAPDASPTTLGILLWCFYSFPQRPWPFQRPCCFFSPLSFCPVWCSLVCPVWHPGPSPPSSLGRRRHSQTNQSRAATQPRAAQLAACQPPGLLSASQSLAPTPTNTSVSPPNTAPKVSTPLHCLPRTAFFCTLLAQPATLTRQSAPLALHYRLHYCPLGIALPDACLHDMACHDRRPSISPCSPLYTRYINAPIKMTRAHPLICQSCNFLFKNMSRVSTQLTPSQQRLGRLRRLPLHLPHELCSPTPTQETISRLCMVLRRV